MLNKDEFAFYCDRVGVPEAGRAYLQRVRASPPARRVQGRGGNVTARYPSRKMGMIIQAESHRNELAAIYESAERAESGMGRVCQRK